MMKVKLTKKVCDDAIEGQIIRDAIVGGFYLKAQKRAKTFCLQRDLYDNGVRTSTKHLVLGRFDQGVTVDAARAEAVKIINEPQRLAAEGMTLREAIALHNTETRAKATSDRYAQIERTGYLVSWMDRPLRSITRTETFDRHQAIAKEVLANKYSMRDRGERQDGRATADNVMRWFRSVWNRAMRADETLPVCPTINVTWHKVARERTAIPSASLSTWFKAVSGVDNAVRRDYLLLVLHSGLRRRSAQEIRWDDIDFANKSLRVPKPKGGAERAFDLPLSKQLVAILLRRKKDNAKFIAGDETMAPWVFPAYSKSGHISEPRNDTGHSIHDLRRTFVTVAESLDLPQTAIGALVNHSQPTATMTAKYVRIELDRLRDPMQRIGSKIESLLKG